MGWIHICTIQHLVDHHYVSLGEGYVAYITIMLDVLS